MDTSFLLLRPEVCTTASVEFTLSFLEHRGINVDDVALVGAAEARRHRWVEQHYGSVHTLATAASADLPAIIGDRPEIKSAFFGYFGELFDAVAAEGRLLSAKDAMTVLGNLSAAELATRWWGNGDFHPQGTTTALGCAPVRLFGGMYVLRLATEKNLYVVNGFYPYVYETCTGATAAVSDASSADGDGASAGALVVVSTTGSSNSSNAKEEPLLCRMTVSWPESRYSWREFHSHIIGTELEADTTTGSDDAVAAARYPEGSLRYALQQESEALGLRMRSEPWAAPARLDSAAVMLKGVEASAGPLASLASRLVWTGLPLEDDDLGRDLLRDGGVPASFARRLLGNPVLLQGGEAVAAFDLTAGMTTTQAVRAVSQLYIEFLEQQQQQQQRGGGTGASSLPRSGSGGLTILDITAATISAKNKLRAIGDDDDEDDGHRGNGGSPLRDSAVLLLRPPTHHPQVLALLEELLVKEAQEHGLTVDTAVDIGADAVISRGVVEGQYRAESLYAVEVVPAAIPISSEADNNFHRTFGECWAVALAAGRVFNAAQALHALGDITPAELAELWEVEATQRGRVARMASGAWVCCVPRPKNKTNEEDDGTEPYLYIINGFYPRLRATFAAPGAVTRCYAVSWPAAAAEVRGGKGSGSNNSGVSPGTRRLRAALDGAFSDTLRSEWVSLGLDTSDSGGGAFALSRGAAEACVMRHRWLGTPLDNDPLYRRCLRPAGISIAPLMQWVNNPIVDDNEDGAAAGDRVLDALAGAAASCVLPVARAVERRLRETAAAAPMNRALVVLQPPAVTAKSIALVREGLRRAGVVVLAEDDVFSTEASARLLGTAAMRGAARLAGLTGPALVAAAGPEAAHAFFAAFGVEWAAAADDTVGAAAACAAATDDGPVAVTPTGLMKRWSDCYPVRLGCHCYCARMPLHKGQQEVKYIVNGFSPYVAERYAQPGARAHYFDVEWAESRWSWADFSAVLIGDRDVGDAAAGSLQRRVSEGWRELGLGERPNHRAQASITASEGPLEAIADRVVWLRPHGTISRHTHPTNPTDGSGGGGVSEESGVGRDEEEYDGETDRFLADPVAQRLVAEGVPVGTVAHYCAGYQSLGVAAAWFSPAAAPPPPPPPPPPQQQQQSTVSTIVTTLTTATAAPMPTPPATKAQALAVLREVSTHRQTTECVRRLKAVSAGVQAAARQHYAFMWLHPSCARPDLASAALPRLLEAHGVHIRSRGELSTNAAQSQSEGGCSLLDSPVSAIYRNAWTREPASIPVPAEQRAAFKRTFGITWETAVQLSLVINAKEAVRRYGETAAIQLWDESPRKACLSATSDDIYVAYLEAEGLYMVNGFYPLLHARVHSGGGSRGAMWFSLSWDARVMSWDEFQSVVMGSRYPDEAPPGSLRRHLFDNWRQYGLAMRPDALVSGGVQVSGSPMEAAAERCLWWGIQPEEDVLGRLLLQQGIGGSFLRDVLRNPPVFTKGSTRVGSPDNTADAFAALPRDPVALAAALRGWQASTSVSLLAPHGAAVLTSPRPLPLPEDECDEEPNGGGGPTPEFEARQREDIVARQAVPAAAAYHPLPLDTLRGTAVVGRRVSSNNSNNLVDKLFPAPAKRGPVAAHAVISVSPTFIPTLAAEAVVTALIQDVLRRHGVTVAHRGALSGDSARQRQLFERQHRRPLRHATRNTGAEIMAVATHRAALSAAFGNTCYPAGLWDAARVGEAHGLTAKRVEEVWDRCAPIARLEGDLFVGKVPGEDLLLVNGFAPQQRDAFYTAAAAGSGNGQCVFLLVEWDETLLSYMRFAEQVIGDAHVATALPGSLHAILRDAWRQLGLPSPPHPFLGALSASDGALAAMRDRQLWMPGAVAFDRDPLGRRAMAAQKVSPFVLQWALDDPREDVEGGPDGAGSFAVGRTIGSGYCGTEEEEAGRHAGARLLDVLAGQGTALTLLLLQSLEVNYRHQQEEQMRARDSGNSGGGGGRNAAFLLVKPHALGRRFGRCIERVLAHHRVRIDDEGDISGGAFADQGIANVLYAATAAYASGPVGAIALTAAEDARLADGLGITWAELVASGRIVSAAEAIPRLAIGATGLFACWRFSRRRVRVRPELEVALVESPMAGGGVYVINGHYPALRQACEAPGALLHWYSVSWPEGEMSWAAFMDGVVGAEDPAEAGRRTIRGELRRHWPRFGLRWAPDAVQNGLYASSGPWQAMMDRLAVVHHRRQPDRSHGSCIERDSLGDLLLRGRGVHPGLIRAWLANPTIVAGGGIKATVAEHLAGFDTGHVAGMVAAVSEAVRAIESERAPPRWKKPPMTEEDVIGAAKPPDSSLLLFHRRCSASAPAPKEGEEDKGPYSNSDDEDEDDIDVHRNTAVLLLAPRLATCPAALQLLRDTLAAAGGRVVGEAAKPATAALLDRINCTEALYGCHAHLAAALPSIAPELMDEEGNSNGGSGFSGIFAASFPSGGGNDDGDESWARVVADGRVVSAAEAAARLRLSPEQLFASAGVEGATLRVNSGLTLTRIKVGGAVEEDDDSGGGGGGFHYVANASYLLARDAFLPASNSSSSDSDTALRMLVVAWDSRDRPWAAFADEVLGADDTASDPTAAAAASGSFCAALRSQWKVLGLDAAPSAVHSGLRVSQGPLQAYAERLAWFDGEQDDRNGGIPDALSRAFASVGADPALLDEWIGNPLVKEVDGAMRRLFDCLCRRGTAEVALFALEVMEAASRAATDGDSDSAALLRRHRPCVLTSAAAASYLGDSSLHQRRTAVERLATMTANRPYANSFVAAADTAVVDIPTAVYTSNLTKQAPSSTVSSHTTKPKPRQRLLAAKVCDALLNARTEADVRQLWEYYHGLEQAPADTPTTATGSSVNPVTTAPATTAAAPRVTISSDAFKRDYTSLESFGAPLPGHQVKSLFAEAEARGRRMRYDEFARALATYQAM